ncbi:MAG: class I SAM-dependent methyltransferase, partial [Elusimicrobiota bacterium]
MAMFKEFYEDELHKDYTSLHVGRSRSISQNMNLFFENPPLKSGKLLDVGCGDGIFLEKAREFGFDVWGIDFDSKSIETARKKRNLRNVFPVSLTEFVDFAKMKNIQFDIITFFEVLEHQDNLQSFIQDITTLLKKDGFVAGSVPNRDRFLAKLSDRAFGFGDYPPHHFTRWSMEVLKIYLEKNGFTNIWLKPCCFFSLLEASYWWQRVILGN